MAEPSTETESQNTSNNSYKDPDKEDKSNKKMEEAREEDSEDDLEETKEKFLDTKEKLIEANKDMTKPGNREYLSFYIKQREWKPTKPLGPIMAQNVGPGPANVNLPPEVGDVACDLRKRRAPTFKFGRPPKNKNKSPTQTSLTAKLGPKKSGPGPAAYDVRCITNKGREICRAPKVGGRPKSPARFKTPGPMAYFRGRGDGVVYRHSPAFSMRQRIEYKGTVETPDPGSYNLPATIGLGKSPLYAGGPAFSMAGKQETSWEKSIEYPGPGDYSLKFPNATNRKAPAYTLGSKFSSQAVVVGENPGPASNDIHLVKFHKPATPRFSFGIRHSPYKKLQTFALGD
ncbi:hypothetical protein JTE90_001537 [Oedothorax gibbosus]|uniref:Uncharacterized protein n=1 Tax=Oedothorax gibbosus TaxID=931172 RepID=A0AAV6VM93_9ARAC|nr:hypothetical protein JTE90_001537 [Oedothorax gibbosus]